MERDSASTDVMFYIKYLFTFLWQIQQSQQAKHIHTRIFVICLTYISSVYEFGVLFDSKHKQEGAGFRYYIYTLSYNMFVHKYEYECNDIFVHWC